MFFLCLFCRHSSGYQVTHGKSPVTMLTGLSTAKE